jgi:cytochrome P450
LPDIQVFLTVALRVHQYHALPRLALRLPRYRRAVANLYEVTKNIVQAYERRGQNDSALLSDLLAARDSQSQPFAPHVHRAIVIGTLLAGLDTVAITAAFALYALLSHPNVLAKARDEVDRVAPDGRLDAQRLESLEYLHAVVLETLRRFPVMSGMARTAGRDFEIAGHRVMQGEEVLLSPVVGHFLERYFPDPDRFNPERMLPPRLEHRQRLAYAPFGAGSHTCLGAGFGELELVALLYTFVRHFELELVPQNYKLRIAMEVTRRPARDLRLRIAGRRR